MTNTCYCDSGQLFQNCCSPLLTGKDFARSPQALMRSRYSAFCSGNLDYLLQTHLTDKAPADNAVDIQATFANTSWLKLEVRQARTSGDTGVVEFVAYYRDQHGPGQLHERSNFRKQDNRWFYCSGVHLAPVKTERNAPCWCGSGKKFKKCCGA